MNVNVNFIISCDVKLVLYVKMDYLICVPSSDLFLKFDIPLQALQPLQFTVQTCVHIYILSLYAAMNSN